MISLSSLTIAFSNALTSISFFSFYLTIVSTVYSIADMNTKYEKNPRLHLKDLYKFKNRLRYKILGEEDNEWRGELEFVLSRTEEKIAEVHSKTFPTRI